MTREQLFYIMTPTMELWERLKELFNFQHKLGRRYYEQDARLHSALLELSEREQRPPEEVQADLLADALRRQQAHDELKERWEALTPREQDVTALTCLGFTNRQIASRLGVSEDTVKTHVKNALVKFNLHGKVELRHAFKDWDFSAWK